MPNINVTEEFEAKLNTDGVKRKLATNYAIYRPEYFIGTKIALFSWYSNTFLINKLLIFLFEIIRIILLDSY